MGQLALTFWFAIATLFGPSLLCCCTAVPQLAAVPKPVKSCCRHDSEPKPVPAPKDKPKCPCQAKASADALPIAVETSDDLAAHIRGTDAAFAQVSPIPFDAFHPRAGAAALSILPSPLSGRALLAAYSILRC